MNNLKFIQTSLCVCGTDCQCTGSPCNCSQTESMGCQNCDPCNCGLNCACKNGQKVNAKTVSSSNCCNGRICCCEVLSNANETRMSQKECCCH